MRREKKKRNKIIIGLISILFLMSVGYAAFQTNLSIKGTSKISSNWDIRITNVTEGNKTGNGENAKTPTWTNLTASMEANLYEKGDAMEYEVTIENKGTFDAKLESITSNGSSNEAIKISFSGYTKGEKLYKNSTQVIKVKIEYNPSFSGTPSTNTNEVSIDLNYVQAEGGTIEPTTDYLLTYDYRTNGGEGNTETAYLSANENVDLSKKGNKEGYTFIGWNTDKNAKEALSMLSMPSEDTVLYAIYKKTINVSYTKGEGVNTIGKTADSCNKYNNEESCEITLPSITANTGYDVDGWYNGTSKIGNQNTKTSIKDNINLTAKAEQVEFTITYDNNGMRNYYYQGDYSTTISGLTGAINDCFLIGNMSLSGLKVDDLIRLTMTVNYENINIETSDKTFGARPQAYGNKTQWSDSSAIQWKRFEQEIIGTGTYEFSDVTTLSVAKTFENDYLRFHIRTDHITSGTLKLSNIKVQKVTTTSETKIKGTTLGSLPIVQEEGYVFDGWYTERIGGTKITNDTVVTGDATYYAHWIEDIVNLNVSATKTTNSITAVATASATSKISKYEFSMDDGNTWIDNGTNNIYTFTGLTQNKTYNVKVRVTSGTDKQTTSDTNVVTTNSLITPTYSETNNGEVTINYPSGCGSEFTCSYSKDSGDFETITSNPTIYFGSNGTLVAKVSDGTNTVSTSTYSVVRNDLYVSSSGNDTSGYGTKTKPYATIQKAYDNANITANINVMDDISQTNTVNMKDNKTIILQSYSSGGTVNSIIRSSTLTTSVINQTAGTTTLNNITIDGNNVTGEQGLILLTDANLIVEKNTVLKNSITTNINGGVMQTGGKSTVEINGGQLINNKAPSSGAIHNSPGCKLTINDGTISNNTATTGSGGAISNYGDLVINSVTISNNIALYDGGAITNACWEGTCGNINMSGGLIESNKAQNGGAMAIHGVEDSASSVVISGGSLLKNKANNGGGAIYIYGNVSKSPDLEISGTTLIDGNTATNGGGILASNAKVTLNSGTLSNNTANETSGEGGAIAFHNTNIGIIKGGTITKNKGWHGFGIMVNGTSTVTMTGGTISENTGSSGAVGLYSTATFILDGGTIKNNTASVVDGGIARWTGGGEPTYTYKSGIVTGNTPTNSYETG